ncbi:PIN domain-containing protein [Lentinula edodes]|uniref:PIN domain-containing protein n=1 Tax=Lentinula lateritia TaxID=40482 RepID=A0A9W9AH46_9AGAR|nr:PIN domain-containing protein [Lentinula edodes]
MSFYLPLQRSALPSRYESPAWDHVSYENANAHFQHPTNSLEIKELQATSDFQNPLQQFSTFANEDVEMQAPLAESSFFVIPDTNVLLHYLDALAAFADDVKRSNLHVMIIVPSAVVDELDWQKKDIWFSRKASVWLWDMIQKKNVLKGQGRNEHIRSYRECKNNDERIIDCALYFARKRPTVLCSADRNLCIDAVAQGEHNLAVMNPHDHKNPRWSSRVLGTFLFGSQFEESIFQQWRPSYTEESIVIARSDDDMGMDMDVDTNDAQGSELYQSDARTLLHSQVIDIFVALLRELVAADQRDLQTKAREGAAASIHAPSTLRSIHAPKRDVKVSDMAFEDILNYVAHPPGCRPINLREGNLSLTRFLSKPYQAYTGWRNGNDWSRQDWLIALKKLKEIGEAWGKRGADIVNILKYDLLPHIQAVFCDDDIRL